MIESQDWRSRADPETNSLVTSDCQSPPTNPSQPHHLKLHQFPFIRSSLALTSCVTQPPTITVLSLHQAGSQRDPDSFFWFTEGEVMQEFNYSYFQLSSYLWSYH